MAMHRREFLSAATATCAATWFGDRAWAGTSASDRASAMLLGSLIGDALGGPIEFLPPEAVSGIMPAARNWDDARTINRDELDRLAGSLRMLPYDTLRPDTASYGPWVERAPAGTITDDSRHKIILMRAVRAMVNEGRHHLTKQDLAKAFLAFSPQAGVDPEGMLAELVEEGLREYRMASRWILGERNSDQAYPVERLWAGVSNCSGQMALLPLAAIFPGQPERAYRETFRLDFIDAPIARDIVSAINAGLSAVLGPAADAMSDQERWELMIETIRATDPYRFAQVPFAGRQLDRWLELSESIVQRSQGRPSVAYRLLETEGKPVYYWDAHFTLLVPLTLLKLCQFDPIAAMHLTLDFGHDTDSYAQIVGAMSGAVHGQGIWSETMSAAVQSRLAADYGETIKDWQRLLADAAALWVDPIE